MSYPDKTKNFKKSLSKCDMVVNSILSDIFDNVYKPGDRLPSENQLTEEYGISRATIREAFKKLNMLNVVSIHQGDGTFVNETNAEILLQPIFSKMIFQKNNIIQLYDARVWLEVAAISMALPKMNKEDHNNLKDLIEEMDIALKNEDTANFSLLDNKMHQYFFGIAGNFVLSSVYGMMRDIFKLYRQRSLKTLPQMRVSNERHHMIIQAIINGDNKAAIELMRRHIEICRLQLMETIEDKQFYGNNYDIFEGFEW